LSVQLVSKISNLCDHNPPTSQTDRRTDGRHAIPRPRICTQVHCAVKKRQALPGRKLYNIGTITLVLKHQTENETYNAKNINSKNKDTPPHSPVLDAFDHCSWTSVGTGRKYGHPQFLKRGCALASEGQHVGATYQKDRQT